MTMSPRFQPNLSSLPQSSDIASASHGPIKGSYHQGTTTAPPTSSTRKPVTFLVAPKQIQFAQDALSGLIHQLEQDLNNSNDAGNMAMTITPRDLAKLKTCSQALLSASYYCLYMAAATSCISEEGCWIGSGMAKAGANRNRFLERDWANARLHYEAYYTFRLGLEEMMAFMKTDPSTVKLYASFEQPLKDLKIECDAHVK